jgi:hypothetical protein
MYQPAAGGRFDCIARPLAAPLPQRLCILLLITSNDF